MYISILDQLFSTSFIYVVSISINVSNWKLQLLKDTSEIFNDFSNEGFVKNALVYQMSSMIYSSMY